MADIRQIQLGSSTYDIYDAGAVRQTDFETAMAGKADIGHTHDDRYYTESEVDTKLSGKAASSHTHDDRYYTESEVDTKLSGKAASSHTHDDRYYTETEVDNAINTRLRVYSSLSELNLAETATSNQILTAMAANSIAMLSAQSGVADEFGFSQAQGGSLFIYKIGAWRFFGMLNVLAEKTYRIGVVQTQNTFKWISQTEVPSHTHDDRYYTESEVDTKLSGKAASSHTHDDRYYTETEVNTLLNQKAASNHSHSNYQDKVLSNGTGTSETIGYRYMQVKDTNTSSYYENYWLPEFTNNGANKAYTFLTTKTPVSVAQGGTGASTVISAVQNLFNNNVSTNATHFLCLNNWSAAGYISKNSVWSLIGGGSIGKKNSLSVSDISDLTPGSWSTLTNSSVHDGTVYYRKTGHIVEVACANAHPKESHRAGTVLILGILPSGYTPSRGYPLSISNYDKNGELYIDPTSGQIRVTYNELNVDTTDRFNFYISYLA